MWLENLKNLFLREYRGGMEQSRPGFLFPYQSPYSLVELLDSLPHLLLTAPTGGAGNGPPACSQALPGPADASARMT
jgi:hypothetical protein